MSAHGEQRSQKTRAYKSINHDFAKQKRKLGKLKIALWPLMNQGNSPSLEARAAARLNFYKKIVDCYFYKNLSLALN
jgi:hypothetical protein